MKIYTRVLAGIMAAGLGSSAVLSSYAAESLQSAQRTAGSLQSSDEAQAIAEMLSLGDYTEGEAIAVVRGDLRPSSSGKTELLAKAGTEAVEDALEVHERNGRLSAEPARQRLQDSEEEQFSIWQVSDPGETTAQILQNLYADTDVILAEPNYVAYAANEEEPQQSSAGEGSTAGSTADAEYAFVSEPDEQQADAPSVDDLTAMQWSLADTSDIYTTPLSPEGGYSLGVAGWKEGRRDENAPANASGTICIMDTGIDTEHPDLQGVLYEFTEEQQKKYGCGRYGYNASGDGRPVSEQKAVGSHGTHVAGIIAAQWNGLGISGVANGAKIFSVNVFGGNGSVQEAKSVVKGFQFLIDAAQEINLKVVNCSWGAVQTQFVFSVMINELAKKGVNTVISSGNRYCDLDESIDLGSQVHSECAIVVNASSPDGSITDFSCWGQDSTDVFAPGGSIISTVPRDIQDGEDGDVYSYENYTRFYPEASDPDSLLSGIERFDSEEPGVLFFDSNPAVDPDAEQIGGIGTQNGFDDKYAEELPLRTLPKEEENPYGRFSAVNGYVYMAIPVSSAEDVRWIGVKTAMSDGFKTSGGIQSVTCADADGNPAEIDAGCVSALKKGWGSGAFCTFYQCQWTHLSYNVDGYIEASNEVHGMLENGLSEDERRWLGLSDYRDPGEITGVYGWENGDRTYVIAKIGVGAVQKDGRQTEVTDDTALYIDNVAAGDEDAFTGSYEIMSGTSMAAPAVAGCLAVIAKDEPESSALTEAELEEEARERAAKLLAAVDYDDSLSELCRTGGRVNLHGQTQFVKKAPLISKVEARDGTLTVEGWYLGSEGKIAVDDREIEAKRREDGILEANITGLPNGSHVVKVTNEDGAVSRAVFSSSSAGSEGRRLYENTHSLPLDEPAFVEAGSDRIYEPAAVCGGRIYTMALTAKYKNLQGLWAYDIADDKWSCCSLPEGFRTEGVNSYCLTALRDRLYLCGTCQNQKESGEVEEESCLWRYEPYGDFWERVDVAIPFGCGGICALGDMIYVFGGSSLEIDGNDDFSFKLYRIDPVQNTITVMKDRLPDGLDTVDMKVAAGKDKIYTFVKYNSDYEMASGSSRLKGMFLRISPDSSGDGFETEDLTGALEEVLGENLRAEFDTKSGANELAEYFTITGIGNGAAVIGSDTAGEDTHIFYDTEDHAVLYGKTSSYHKAFDPVAAYSNGTLYVIGYNTTEPDVMYFRSDRIEQAAQPETSGENAALQQETAGHSKYLGIATIALFAGIALLLTGLRKK